MVGPSIEGRVYAILRRGSSFEDRSENNLKVKHIITEENNNNNNNSAAMNQKVKKCTFEPRCESEQFTVCGA